MTTVDFGAVLLLLSSQYSWQRLLQLSSRPTVHGAECVSLCFCFFFHLRFLFQGKSAFGICSKMNFRIHTVKENVNRGVLLNLNGSVSFKNSSHVIVSVFKMNNCANSAFLFHCSVFSLGGNFLAR